MTQRAPTIMIITAAGITGIDLILLPVLIRA